MKSLLGFAAGLLLSNVAVAQYAGPPGYASPPTPPPAYEPPPAYAPPPPEAPTVPRLTGVVLSTELGYSLPFGDAYMLSTGRAIAMSDREPGQVPMAFGVGYRIHPMVSVGGIFQYGFARVDETFAAELGCTNPGFSCSGSDLRVGIEGRVHFRPENMFSPWASVGFGYNWFGIHQSYGSQSGDLTFGGFELLNLEAGGDFRVASIFTIGPFMGLRLQQWNSFSSSVLPSGMRLTSIPDDNQPVHGWVSFGVRGALTL